MRRVLTATAFLVVSVTSFASCGPKPEWVIPKSGEAACMCTAVCACSGMSQSDESKQERERCWSACDCAPCPSGGGP